jgi:hypothetical protein
MLELAEYRQNPKNGLRCEKIDKELLLDKARSPEVKAKCESLLRSKNIDYGFINPTIEPRVSKDCPGLFEYDIVCKYIDKSGSYIEKFEVEEKSNNIWVWIVIGIVAFILMSK